MRAVVQRKSGAGEHQLHDAPCMLAKIGCDDSQMTRPHIDEDPAVSFMHQIDCVDQFSES